MLHDFDEEREWVIWNKKTGHIIKKGTIRNADQIETLTVDHEDVVFGIKGFPLYAHGKEYIHPDDYKKNKENIQRQSTAGDEDI